MGLVSDGLLYPGNGGDQQQEKCQLHPAYDTVQFHGGIITKAHGEARASPCIFTLPSQQVISYF
jgi:hypothetical protein